MPMSTNNTGRVTTPGISSIIPLFDKDIHPRGMAPGVLVNFAAGTTANVDVVVTADDVTSQNYNAAAGIWNILDGAGGLTASGNFTLAGKVTAVALRVNSISAGAGVNLGVVV